MTAWLTDVSGDDSGSGDGEAIFIKIWGRFCSTIDHPQHLFRAPNPKCHPSMPNGVLFAFSDIHTNMIAWLTYVSRDDSGSGEAIFTQIWGRFCITIDHPQHLFRTPNPKCHPSMPNGVLFAFFDINTNIL